MRKPYFPLPLPADNPDPVTKLDKSWTPILQVQVGRNHQFYPTPMMAIVDSGSPYCLFRADIAKVLKITNLESGKPGKVAGVNVGKPVTYYFHKISLKIERNWLIEVYAGFAPELTWPAILGRNGFFDQFYVKFDHAVNPPHLEIERIELVQ